MHRDLKPENLLFKNKIEFDIVIADFGLASYVNEKELLYKRCGTPGFVAPEILNYTDNEVFYN
jgi:serine/threonine protein kinase